jgi:hypothetical protein
MVQALAHLTRSFLHLDTFFIFGERSQRKSRRNGEVRYRYYAMVEGVEGPNLQAAAIFNLQ